MSDAFKDALLEDERIIWSGAPNYDRAAPKKIHPKFAAVAWAIALAVAIAAMLWASQEKIVSEFLRGAFGFIGAILLLILVFVCLYIAQGRQNPRPRDRYTLTNLRLMVTNDETGQRESYFGDSLIASTRLANGAVHNLLLMLAHSEEQDRVLYALDDATAVEKLLIQHGIARRPKS